MEANLDGVEVTIIKGLGLSGSTSGLDLVKRIPSLGDAQLISALNGLIAVGYIESDGPSLQTIADVNKSNFNVNSGYVKAIREALDPQPTKSKRVRRE